MIYCQKKISGANPSMVPIMGVLIFRGAKYPSAKYPSAKYPSAKYPRC